MRGPAPIVRAALAGYGGLFAATLLATGWQGRLPDLFPPPRWPDTGVHLLVGAAVAAGALTAAARTRGAFAWARRLDEEFRLVLGGVGRGPAIILAVSSGLAEEAFFRGLMQPALGLVWTSILFGLAHFPVNRRLVPWTLLAAVMGVLLGSVYEATGSLLAVAVAHGLINFVELLRLGRTPAPEDVVKAL